MKNFVLRNKFVLLILSFIFIYFNFRIVNNFGFYNDDWLFFTIGDQKFYDWALRVWYGEGGEIRRHIVAPYYIFLHFFPKEIVYSFSIILSLIIFYLIFILFRELILKNFNYLDNNQTYLNIIILILAWYFFPFNIGGQFWITAIIHTKISTIFFLIHLILLSKNRINFAIFFLILCFNSYEIFFFSYLPLTLIFFFGGLIDNKILRKYLIYSIFFQIFFLLDKQRTSHNIDISNIIILSLENILRFFWSIYSLLTENVNFKIKSLLIFLLFSIFVMFLKDFFKEKNKKLKINFLICISFAFLLNAVVHTVGTYGYWGKGIFSRTMFLPSLLLLFFFIFFITTLKKRISLYLSFCLLFFSCILFNFEIKNWEKSAVLQQKIIDNFFSSEKKFNFISSNKKLILFFGPCYVNGVDIFNAAWDLHNAILFKDLNYKNDTFVPIQDWNIQYSSTMSESSITKKNDILIVHNYNFNLNNFDQIYFWDFFNNKMHKISKVSNIALQINKIRNNRNCSLEIDYKLKAKNDKNNLIEFLQIKNFNFLKKN
jgi:hypothetical protein